MQPLLRLLFHRCKRYEKLPIAVLRDAVPYDFGGIDVIDKLPLPSSKKSEEEGAAEGTTQSTVSGPEEPSLTNVVTAAEDFIKVLATVSTSQSSTTDSEKGEAQSSEKKKRKKKKKVTKKQKGKGKGRKRKQKAEAGVKAEEGAAVSTSGSKAEEVNALSNFISDSHKRDQASRDRNRVADSEYELGGKDEPSNEVMKDEPAMDKEAASIVSPATVRKKPAESTQEMTVSTSTSTTTIGPQKAKTKRLKKQGKKKSKAPALPSHEELAVTTTDTSVPAIVTETPAAQPEQQSPERRPLVSTARAPIVIPKVKRNRSKERGEGEGRKKRKKDGSASPIVAAPQENSTADNLKVIPPTGAPTVPSVHTAGRQLSHRLDIHGGRTIAQVSSLNSSFSVLKRKKSQARGLRSRRRNTFLPLLNSPELPVLPTPDTSVELNPATTAAINSPTTETHSEWRLFTTITIAPSIMTKRHRQTIRQQRKQRKKAVAAALSQGFLTLTQTEQTPMTFTTSPSKVATPEELKTSVTTSAAPVMSPIQLSIERAKAQFSRKKRRKAMMSSRQ